MRLPHIQFNMVHLIKSLSIRHLTYLMFGGFVILATINFVIFNRIDNKISDNIAAQHALDESWEWTEEITPLAEDIMNGHKESAEILVNNIKKENALIDIINDGGRLGLEKRFKHLGDSSKLKASKLSAVWKKFKPHFDMVIYGTNGRKGEENDSLGVISPMSSLHYIQLNHSDILTARHQLYKALKTEYYELKDAKLYTLIFFLVFNITAIISVLSMTTKHLFNPLDNLTKTINTINEGSLDVELNSNKKNELGLLSNSVGKLVESIKNATTYVKNIGNDTENIELTQSSDIEIGSNSLEGALLQMNEKLNNVAQEEKERNWVTEGMAKFVEILRSTDSDVKELNARIISNLVDYTNSNQGGIFLTQGEGDEQCLELSALYAFDTHKLDQRKIKLGEGLVGQTFLEKKTTYLTNIPSDYVSIVSGLGGANPKAILVVPMQVNDSIFGVIELASFDEYKPYEIEFVEKLGESIASTIESVKTNERTKLLLQQSQQMTEQLRAQEEEMRQNMEELSATQEEVSRRAEESDRLLAESLQKTKYQEVLYAVSREKSYELNELLQNSIDIICDAMSWPIGHVYFASKNQDGVLLKPSDIWSKNSEHGFRNFKKITKETFFEPTIGLPGKVYSSKKAYWIEDVTEDQGFLRMEIAKSTDIKSAFAFAIIHEDQVIGVVEFFSMKKEEYGQMLNDFMDKLGELIGSKLAEKPENRAPDELASMLEMQLEELSITQEQLSLKLDESQHILQLSNDQISIIIADNTGNLTYVNDKAKEVVSSTSKTVEDVFPSFNATGLSAEEGLQKIKLQSVDSVERVITIKYGSNKQIYLSWV